MEKHETRYSSRLSRCYRALCLRAYLPDPLDDQGRNAARRNLLKLPSVLHWEAETCRHRRPRGALQQEICQRSGRCWQEVTAKDLIRFMRGPVLAGPLLFSAFCSTD